MIPPGAPLRRLRWYDIITPQLLGQGGALAVGGGAFLLWKAQDGTVAAVGHLRALAHDFLGLNLLLDFSNLLALGACLWVLLHITDPALPARFRVPTRRIVLIGFTAGAAAVLGSSLLEYLSDTFLHTDVTQDTLSMPVIPHYPSQLVLGIFTAALLAPLAEEAYFRGVLMGWFARHGGKGWAIAGSSLLFGLLHLKLFAPGGLNGIVITGELVLMGVLLGAVAARTGSLWASFLAHATNNMCAVLASVFLAH